jgi:uncharacterized protein (DUF952 family)
VPDLVLLVIDPTQLSAPLVYAPPAPLPSHAPKPADGDLYPHCYGPIDLAAIVDVIELAQFPNEAYDITRLGVGDGPTHMPPLTE